MENARPPDALVLEGGPEDRAEAWRQWLKQFKVYLKATGLYKHKPVQVPLLIKYIGADGYDIYSTFNVEGEDNDIDVLIQKFDKHFRPKPNTMARYHFFTRNQKEGENIDAYVTALKLISQYCEFDHLEDSLIRDRIVCGLIDSGVRHKLLNNNTDELSLEKAVRICKASELLNERTRQSVEKIQSLEQRGAGEVTRGSRLSGTTGNASTEACAQAHGSQVTSAMVSTLNEDEKTKSTKAEAPAVCNSCNSVINGRIVTALNKKWHPEHFTCNTCRKPIDGAKFHQHDGGVHCVPCFAAHHSPRCHGCGEPITDRVIQALGVSWHANHFVCGGCKKELGGGGFMEQAGRPYCSGCYADKFAARCNGCGSPITDKAIIALDAKWHRDCFTCMKCRNPVTDATFSVMDNKPLCGKCA